MYKKTTDFGTITSNNNKWFLLVPKNSISLGTEQKRNWSMNIYLRRYLWAGEVDLRFHRSPRPNIPIPYLLTCKIPTAFPKMLIDDNDHHGPLIPRHTQDTRWRRWRRGWFGLLLNFSRVTSSSFSSSDFIFLAKPLVAVVVVWCRIQKNDQRPTSFKAFYYKPPSRFSMFLFCGICGLPQVQCTKCECREISIKSTTQMPI